MQRYITRPGIILTSICGEYFLVATAENLPHCPYITELNETSAFMWKQLQKTADMKTLMEAVEEEYEVDDKEVLEQSIANFLAQLLEKNLILLF